MLQPHPLPMYFVCGVPGIRIGWLTLRLFLLLIKEHVGVQFDDPSLSAGVFCFCFPFTEGSGGWRWESRGEGRRGNKRGMLYGFCRSN